MECMRIICPKCYGGLHKYGEILHHNVITRKYVCKKCGNLVQTEEKIIYSEKSNKED